MMGGGFWVRAISAVIMAPLAILAVIAGSPLFDAVLALAAVVLGWEWERICGAGRFRATGYVLCLGILGAMGAVLIGAPIVALILLAVAALSCFFLADRHRWLTGLGPVYIGIPALALQSLRGMDGLGLETAIWVLALVWATDTGAYLVGRSLGGPKLAPRVSPNKTWSGLTGGVLAAALTGAVMAVVIGTVPIGILALASGGLAVVAQLGDLFESGVKRRFNLKDSSQLIPGHGGLLDRVDGLLAVAPLAAVLVRML